MCEQRCLEVVIEILANVFAKTIYWVVVLISPITILFTLREL